MITAVQPLAFSSAVCGKLYKCRCLSSRPIAVSVQLHPSTGDEEDKRFVCLTLVIHLPDKVHKLYNFTFSS